MRILSDGVPMTNGEAYALLRRRRDERSAVGHLPFSLQRVQADPHSRTSTTAIQYRSTAPAASTVSGVGAGNGAAEGVEANSLLATATAGHLAILLTEVHVLQFLSQPPFPREREAAGALDGSGERTMPVSMRELYGPATVYDGDAEESDEESDAGAVGKFDAPVSGRGDGIRSLHPTTGGGARVKGEEEGAGASSGAQAWLVREQVARECAAAERALRRAVARTHAGRKSHVRSVGCALAYYEARGRMQERRWARGVAAVLAQLQSRGYWPVREGVTRGDAGDGVKMEAEATESPLCEGGRSRFLPSSAVAGGRPLLSRPHDLVAMAGEDFMAPPARAPGAGVGAPAAHTAAALLSEAEVMQLVVGRPTTRLQVYRLLDDLDARLGHVDEAVNYFVKSIIDVFSEE